VRRFLITVAATIAVLAVWILLAAGASASFFGPGA
jgi:hypothetical protein